MRTLPWLWRHDKQDGGPTVGESRARKKKKTSALIVYKQQQIKKKLREGREIIHVINTREDSEGTQEWKLERA